MVQWLRHHASTAGGKGSISGRGTKIPPAMGCGQPPPPQPQNKRTTYHKTWAAAKAVFRGKFIDINGYIKIEKKITCLINNLTSHLKEKGGRKEQTNPKLAKRRK